VSVSTSPAGTPVLLTEAVICRHQAGVWRFLRLLGADPATADDLTQDTFLRLCERAPADRGDAALAAWLRRVAANLFVDSRRRSRGGLPLDSREAEAAFAAYARDDGGASYRAALDAGLRALSDRDRRALEIRYAPGGSRAAVAAVFGVGDQGAKSILDRARARLTDHVQRSLRSES
jgi:RNA polymerase sigma-70 factor (ECF subfamily)